MESSNVVLSLGTWLEQTTPQRVSGTLGEAVDNDCFEDNGTMESPPGSGCESSGPIVDTFLPSTLSATHSKQVVSSTQFSSTLLQAALFRAVATGNLVSLKLMVTAAKELDLLGKAGNVESISNIVNYDQRTLLHLASAEGHLDIVSFLLENQADPYAKDRWGATPIDDAWENNHMEVIKVIEAFVDSEGKSGPVVNMERKQKDIEHRLDTGIDIPYNRGHRPLGAFASIPLTSDFPYCGLRRTVSSPVETENFNEPKQRERSVSCQEDDSFMFLAERFFPMNFPFMDRDNFSEGDSPILESPCGERKTEDVAENDASDNGSEQEEESQLMMVAQEELDRAYRSEKDKIFQKYRKIIEEKLGSVPNRLRLLSLI
ncbi:Glutaminase liver isoform, mitochondrial [Galdieria sulphuraria]|uniref:Glutaminase n=1 Tax=Galdieria sulphuraria TaxID=130081 RepID=M2X8D2_GALSU|nr:glutaminase [Galdieria sulphuraria]EME32815.1 glutaminase [Galdieria sulphuraria]GJD12637.1 Glutaminase liver isoform, mitochondrial [Galdieria sulphuraria]|eukprot:XP_005709335.1 glutaminase [Galdieria sulphuraria]